MAQRGEVEVLAETGNHGDLVIVAANLVIKGDFEQVARPLVEDIGACGLLVGLGEIAAFHNLDAHEAQKVP